MTIVRSLSGWILFAIIGSFAPDKWAALAGLLITGISLWLGLRESRTVATVTVEIASTVFFAALTLLLFAAHHLHPGIWVSVASQLWLAGAVGVTLAIGRPFTLAIATREAPREFRESSEFFAFNVNISRAWMLSFLISAIPLAAMVATGVTKGWPAIPIIILAILVPVAYTRREVGKISAPRIP